MRLTVLSMARVLVLIALCLLSSAAVMTLVESVLQPTLRPHATRLRATRGLQRHVTAISCQLCLEMQLCSFVEIAPETQQHTVALTGLGREKSQHSPRWTSAGC